MSTQPPVGDPAADVAGAIDAASDPETAVALRRYFQVRPGGYGAGDQFAGVKLSTLRTIVAPYRRRPFRPQDWLPLLTSPIHEHRLAALVVMAERAGRGDEAERQEIYDCYLAHTAYVCNWDLVDVSAAPVVGRHLLEGDRGVLDRLAGSSSLWERRIAVVATHAFLRAGQSADTYRLALRLRDDPEDLIHKAIGWMLREAGRRVDAGELRRFLDEHGTELPRTALRAAIEPMTADVRRHYLSRHPTGPGSAAADRRPTRTGMAG
ncbi:MAG TPA: DNA alkylation repair protein [Microlunatus sp.]|nr:DNA alkylation repair protein [Microlunatus sp.]